MKMHEGATILHPWSNRIEVRSPFYQCNIDAALDDELSPGSSSLLDLSPPKNNVEAESRKRPPHRSSHSVSGMHH